MSSLFHTVLLLVLLLVSLCICGGITVSSSVSFHSFSGYHVDPEVDYNSIQLITSKGYAGEEHFVNTVDGYILGLHRIPYGRNQKEGGNRPVFFLQHGLLCSSADWLVNLANQSLGYVLADNGYDVWIGNVRGNTYSRNHTFLKPSQKEFWNFTFDEHAQKDLPAMIEYVLKVTNQSHLFYVGHSQGTIMGFAGFTFNQTLASRIKMFFALAPVVNLTNIKGAIRVLAEHSTEVAELQYKYGSGEYLPTDSLMKFLAKHVCNGEQEYIQAICGMAVFLTCGFDPSNLNISRLPVYYAHTPAGTSIKNILHLSQGVLSGRFAQYDYGDDKVNIQHYGVSPSPSYNVSAIKVPMALFTGGHDWLADPEDVADLLPKLQQTGKVVYHKNIDYYNHLDFLWGMDAATAVYKNVIELARKNTNI